VKKFLVAILGLVLTGSLCAEEEPSLRCYFYPISVSDELKPNVRFSRPLFGLGKQIVEIDPEQKGVWEKAKTIDSSERQISFKDGWGFTNSKNCKDAKFNALDHCPTSKIIEKRIIRVPNNGLDVVKAKQWFETDCCYDKTQYAAGDVAKKGVCIVLRVLD